MSNSTSSNNRSAGMILLGLGAFFLLSQIFNFSLWALLWPLFIIIPGLPFLYGAYHDESGKNAGLIFPGLLITGTGLMLLYQSVTGHWESWAYAWTLYPVLVGVGLQFNGSRNRNKSEVKTGEGMVRYGLMAFAGLALLFEVFIFGLGGLFGSLWPLLLLGGGAYLLMKNQNTTTSTTVKPKREVRIADKPKRSYDDGPSAEINPELRRKIEAALAEDDEKAASNGGEV